MPSNKPIELIIDDKRLQEGLAKVAAKTQQMAPLMETLSGIMGDAVEEAFETEGGRPNPLGDHARKNWPFADLADVTKENRAAIGKWPGKKLQVMGDYAASFSTAFGRDFATAGTNKKGGNHSMGAIHHFGTDKAGRGRKTVIPPRPVLILTQRDMDEMIDETMDYLENL